MSVLNYFIIIFIIFIVNQSKALTEYEQAKIELEKYINEAKLNVSQRYRLTYHVAAPVGWINDPNGFSYFQGNYHLFYQYYPYDSVWGPMHWGHVVSSDLVNWKTLPTALLPEKEQIFSGSAISRDDYMIIMYTAHEILEDGQSSKQTQYLAYSCDGVDFMKYEGNPVIARAPNDSPDFRDPKLWRHDNHWYVILGSKTDDGQGRVLLYRSTDMVNWVFLTILAESNGDLGYMWECPDFFELNGKHILLMSPQGVEPEGDKYKNLYQTGYIVGSFNYSSFEFIPETEFVELDYGHDFYAAQTMDANGRRLLVAWFGMWESEFPEAVDGWAGAMTVVRELKLDNNNRILMEPVTEMLTLRDGLIHHGILRPRQNLHVGQASEIELSVTDWSLDFVILFEGVDNGGSLTLSWDAQSKKVALWRDGNVRQVQWSADNSKSWRIYLDTSSFELFCGDSDVVFSTRAYPLGGWVIENISNAITLTVYKLKRSVPL